MPRTSLHQLGQAIAHALQLRDALVDRLQAGRGAFAHAFHAAMPVGRQGQQFADFLQGETQVLGPANEPQPRDGTLVVLTVSRGPAPGLGQEPFPLVEPDGVDGDARALRDAADGEGCLGVHGGKSRPLI